ncbi:uncharacterized protein A4U43_C02F2490 [Asparagus officinalis]|uniref:Uncharacterized protein n=1 Tax=Asparagus officinalis TaxID=4686 RepID=A0A5P1FK47_ASPOF|nr:uncharacterized protein A4U43_C02F2490 [Asparagus officinalis]
MTELQRVHVGPTLPEQSAGKSPGPFGPLLCRTPEATIGDGEGKLAVPKRHPPSPQPPDTVGPGSRPAGDEAAEAPSEAEGGGPTPQAEGANADSTPLDAPGSNRRRCPRDEPTAL